MCGQHQICRWRDWLWEEEGPFFGPKRVGGEDKGRCQYICLWWWEDEDVALKEGWLAGGQDGGISLFNESDEDSEEKG